MPLNDFVLVNHVIYQARRPGSWEQHSLARYGRSAATCGCTTASLSTTARLIGSGRVNAAHIDSGSALATQFLRADGSQGALWAVPAGGGGGTAFHLYNDVTNQNVAGGLAADDRMLLADVSHTSNRNVYAILGDVHQSLYATIASAAHFFTGLPADNDLIVVGDTSRGTETRVRGMQWSSFEAALQVADMDSGTATDGQVPSADGSGGIDWEDPSGGGGGLATTAPEDVADTAAVGTDAVSARGDHVHELVNDETLEFSSAGTLGVSITDVIEHLTQRIRYFTS